MEKLEGYLDYYCKEKGYNCAKTVLHAANDAWGLNLDESVYITMGGFGGGMATRNVCGAVSGGIAAMGYLYIDETGHESPLMMAKVKLLMELVKEKLGDEKCSFLEGKYKTQEEGCIPTIRVISDIIDEVVETNMEVK